MRHGQAEEFAEGGDAQRALTSEGRRMAMRAGHLLKVANLMPTAAIASPFLRAQQTASGVLREAYLDAVAEPRLVPSAPPDLAITALIEAATRAGPSGRVLAVGHNPCITAVLGRLVAGGAMRFAVSTGDVAHLAIDVERRTAVVLAYIPAAVLAGLLEER